MQITQPVTSACTPHNEFCQSILYIVETLDKYVYMHDKTYPESLALRYIISDDAMDFIK